MFDFDNELSALKKQGLLRHLLWRSSAQGPLVTINGRRYVNFGSNDYLGLAAHPLVAGAARDAALRFGFGAGASRLLAGGTALHERLERSVARLKGTEAALVFNSGYAANTGIIPAIAGEGDALFSDELNHASIVDGCRLSRARRHIYRHRDVSDLEGLLGKEKRARRRIVLTDSVFSMDGDIAPLPGLCEVCTRHGAMLYIDDAHATGVLGGGRGSLAHFGIRAEPWMVQMGTFSKALGSFGAFVAGSREMIDWLVNTARTFVFSTALPAPVIAASLKAMAVMRRDASRLKRLQENRSSLAAALQARGWNIRSSETPILPVLTRTVEEATSLSQLLFSRGVYAPAIRPPTVTAPRIRLTVTAAHTAAQIERLLRILDAY